MVRAIYQNGHLRLLDPVELQDGQEVEIQFVPRSLEEAAADLLISFEPTDDAFDDEAAQRQLDKALRGKRPLSEIIIEERRESR